MNNTLHTGGDWYVQRIHTMKDETPHDYDIWAVYSTQRTRYADKPQDICSFNWRTPAGKANAHLISAAPDLLSALESLAVWYNGEPCFCHVHGESERARYTPHDSYCDKARAAIAKAKGEA